MTARLGVHIRDRWPAGPTPHRPGTNTGVAAHAVDPEAAALLRQVSGLLLA
ncbi:hypothetical protein JIX56_43130 [Streptomyces sp. CA-210063]|uniref:hypothetical protein n=1 Tax=Streptomyces sp. CA-210063 TaxID=2801029 RepID=UPI00214B9EA6|nr:hypothetical protein [Streptomyces sp. CA-210063]UUU36086.1 hypothetical protein JIX56_43130 [Streptomyces sp. CA-210063]